MHQRLIVWVLPLSPFTMCAFSTHPQIHWDVGSNSSISESQHPSTWSQWHCYAKQPQSTQPTISHSNQRVGFKVCFSHPPFPNSVPTKVLPIPRDPWTTPRFGWPWSQQIVALNTRIPIYCTYPSIHPILSIYSSIALGGSLELETICTIIM